MALINKINDPRTKVNIPNFRFGTALNKLLHFKLVKLIASIFIFVLNYCLQGL